MGTPWVVTWRDECDEVKTITVQGCTSEGEAMIHAAEILDFDENETGFSVLSAVPAGGK